MSLTVNQTCERLNNRLDTPLLFEGRRVKLRPNDSVCRQLYQLWRRRSHQVLDYGSFKQSLRFQLARDVTRVTMARDLSPWVAGGLTAAGLGAASLWYLKSRNEKTPTGNTPTQKRKIVIPDYAYDTLECGEVKLGVTMPAVFANGDNSCYFHSAMLMLYQMKDWFLDTKPQPDSTEVQNAAPLLNDLKHLIRLMSTHDTLPFRCFRPLYERAQSILFPTEKRCQEDADEFLGKVFDRVKDRSEVDVKRVTHQWASKELLPLISQQKEVPEQVTLDFIRRNVRNQKGEIIFDDYTYDGKEIVKEPRKKLFFIDVEKIPEVAMVKHELTQSNSIRESVSLLPILPGPDFFANIRSELDTVHEFYTRCKNPDYYPDLMVRCLATMTYEPLSKYFIVRVQYDKRSPNIRPELTQTDIDLQGRTYTLIGVTFRGGATAGSGHYTAAIKIGEQWLYYDDLGPKRYKIESLSAINLWPQTLLFRRVDQEPPQ